MPDAREERSAVIDAVIVSYNSARTLRCCVESLVAVDEVRVLVVDNASQDGSLDTVSDLSAEMVPQPDNRGFAHGCNVGWRRGKAQFVLFVTPDAVIDPTVAAL